MAKVEYDRIFTGRQHGTGEQEMKGFSSLRLKENYYVPDAASEERLSAYLEAEDLLDPDKHFSIWTSEPTVSDPEAENNWIPLDFPGMLTRLMRQYTLGEEFHVRAKARGVVSGEDEFEAQDTAQREAQAVIDRITEFSNVERLLRQVAEQLPAYGDAVVKIDLVDAEDPDTGEMLPTAQARYIRPHHYFPTLHPLDGSRVTKVELAWVFPKSGDRPTARVLREIHTPGRVEYALNIWSNGDVGASVPLSSEPALTDLKDYDTGIDEIPIVHFGYQTRAGEHFGQSEIKRVQRIILALENRLAQEDEVLDKHARPKLIVGPGVLDDGGAKLRDFDVIEISPDIFEKAVKPDYLTWDMQIQGIQHEIEKLEEYLFMTTETSPASFGLERDGSQVESARALRFKAHRTVNKVNDVRGEISPSIKALYRIAQKLELAARMPLETGGYRRSDIVLRFGDPIVEDQTQEVLDYTARKQAGLVSRRRAVMDLDNLTAAEAEAEVRAILQDQVDEAAASTATLGGLDFAAGGPPGLTPEETEPEGEEEPEELVEADVTEG